MKKLWITLLMALCTAVGLAGLSACDLGGLNAGGSEQGGTSDTGDTGNTDNTGDNTGDNTDDGDDTGDNTDDGDNTGDDNKGGNTDDGGNTGDEQVDPPAPSVKTYTVTVNCGEGGECNLSETSPVEENTSLTLTVVEHVGYELSSFQIDGVETELTEFTYTFTVTKDVVVDVTFTSIPVVYRTVKVTAGDGGSCTLSDEGEVAEKTVVTLTVTPDEGYEVDKFYVNGKSAELTDGTTYTFTVTGNVTLKVSFKKHVHAYPAWEITEPTENTEGLATRTCPNCTEAMQGHTLSHVLPALSDKRYKIETHSVESCTSEGSYTYTITVDGVTLTWNKTVEQLPHAYTYAITKPTEEVAGSATGTCQTCAEGAEGHVRTFELPVLSDSRYQRTGHVAICLEKNPTFTLTVDGYAISFDAEVKISGHHFVAGSDGKQVCSVCGEKEGMLGVNYISEWHALDGDDHFILGGNTIYLADGTTYDISSYENKPMYKNRTYSLELVEGTCNGQTFYTLVRSRKLSSGLWVKTLYYNEANYPIPAFEGAVEGFWEAVTKDGGMTLDFYGKSFRVNGEATPIRRYTTTAAGFELYFTIGTKDGGSVVDYGEYTFNFNKTTGTATWQDDAAQKANEKSGACTKSATAFKALLPEQAGTYTSSKGNTILIDEEGHFYLNGVSFRLDSISEDGTSDYLPSYQFISEGVCYTVKLLKDGKTINVFSAADGRDENFTKQPAE